MFAEDLFSISNLIKFKADNIIVEPSVLGIGLCSIDGPRVSAAGTQTVASTVKSGKESSSRELQPSKHNPRLNDSGPSNVCSKLANVLATFLAAPHWPKVPHLTPNTQKNARPSLGVFLLPALGRWASVYGSASLCFPVTWQTHSSVPSPLAVPRREQQTRPTHVVGSSLPPTATASAAPTPTSLLSPSDLQSC